MGSDERATSLLASWPTCFTTRTSRVGSVATRPRGQFVRNDEGGVSGRIDAHLCSNRPPRRQHSRLGIDVFPEIERKMGERKPQRRHSRLEIDLTLELRANLRHNFTGSRSGPFVGRNPFCMKAYCTAYAGRVLGVVASTVACSSLVLLPVAILLFPNDVGNQRNVVVINSRVSPCPLSPPSPRFWNNWPPSRLAEEWDNVGLLVGHRGQNVKKLMTCLTVTPASAAEAIEAQRRSDRHASSAAVSCRRSG